MKSILTFSLIYILHFNSFSQADSLAKKSAKVVKKATEIPPLKLKLNDDGSHYFQITFLNQTWLRFNENNPGTTLEGDLKKHTIDIGLRRTRIQMFGQLSDRAFVYFQFGQNNFNSQFAVGANRKVAVFFHDALCEYRLSAGNQLVVGGGLTIANGLSRFSQPSIGTIMTMDVPVFAQATVDQTDEFSRKLSVYARGQIGKIDYRLIFSDPFPIASNGQPPIAISTQANFARKGHTKQYQGFFQYQFFEREVSTTPYMTGTYLGKKKIFNLGTGIIYQPNAMWKQGLTEKDTVYQPMVLWAAEAFLDVPLNKEKGTAISAYLGYFNYNFGTDYLRYNGLMNPATGINSTVGKVGKSGTTFGNAYPMFGSGQSLYGQFGYLFSNDLLGENGTLMPYISATYADWNRLGMPMTVYNSGINWLMNGHKAKFTLDWQNRPVYLEINGTVKNSGRRNCLILQYQIFI
jgi:hypothetical protein